MYVPQSAQPPDVIPAIPELPVTPKRQLYAGFWLRLAAYLIDSILISPFFGMIVAFRPAIFIKPPDPAATLLISLPQPTPQAIALSIVISTFYFTLFEASSWQALAWKADPAPLRYGPAPATPHSSARGDSQFREDHTRHVVPGGALAGRFHGEEARSP